MKLKKFSKFEILLMTAFVFFFPPDGIWNILEIKNEIIPYIIETVGYGTFMFFLVWKGKIHISYFLCNIGALRLLYICSDLYNGESFLGDSLRMIIIIGLVELIIVLYNSGYEEKVLRAISTIVCVYIIINFVYIIAFPAGYLDARGWTNNYFLGQKNRHVYYYMLWFLSTGRLRALYGTFYKKVDVFILVLQVVSSFICKSSTGFVVALLLLTITVLPCKVVVLFMRKWTIEISLLFSGIITVLLTSYSFILKPVVQYVFHKDLTFSSRTVIWNVVIQAIQEHPIFGNGGKDIAVYWGWNIGHAHNKTLDLLYCGGIILLLTFIILMLALGKVLAQVANNNLVVVFNAIVLGYSIVFLMESPRGYILQDLTLAILYCSALSAVRNKNGQNRDA